MIAPAWRWVRSLVFVVQMYLAMALLALVFTPWAILDRAGAFAGIRTYCRYVRWSARWMVGLTSEIRGPVPVDEVMIAAKHQSFFDIILIYASVPRGKFIMKKELTRAPILGQYALRIGCIPVDRGRRGQAVKQMLADVAAGKADPGQLIIYPQGTRVAAGVRQPYKVGVGVLYDQLGQDCVPAATNVGVFWPRHGILRKRGLAVVEFLPRIPAGKSVSAFMREIEPAIEGASDRLMVEAGFVLPEQV